MVPYLKIRHWQRASVVKVGQPEWGTANPRFQWGLNVHIITHQRVKSLQTHRAPGKSTGYCSTSPGSSTHPSLGGEQVSLQVAQDALSSNQRWYNPPSSLYFAYPVSLAGACDGRWQRPWENSAWSMTVTGCCVLTSICCSTEPFRLRAWSCHGQVVLLQRKYTNFMPMQYCIWKE